MGQNEGFWRFFTNRGVEIGLFLTLTRFFGKWPKIRANYAPPHVQDSKKSPRLVGLIVRATSAIVRINLKTAPIFFRLC